MKMKKRKQNQTPCARTGRTDHPRRRQDQRRPRRVGHQDLWEPRHHVPRGHRPEVSGTPSQSG